jgi:17beta-estradiol 17-dehydrogenase / very-long-chain 3-oxoacyl-CoA reductase
MITANFSIITLLLIIFLIGPYIYHLALILYKYTCIENNLIKRYGSSSWVIITGASRGQGRCMAIEMASRGFNLILIGSSYTNTVIKDINSKYPAIKIKFIEKDFSHATDNIWWDDIIELFNGSYDISILFNNVGYRSFSKPSHMQKTNDICKSIITGTIPQVRLTNLALTYMEKRVSSNPLLHCAIIFNTAQCIHPILGLSQYYSPIITVPYLSVYEATNAFGYYHASSIIDEYYQNKNYKNIDMLNITPGAVLTEKTNHILTDVLFSIPAEQFVKNIIRLLGNWQGTTCAYWGHEIAPLLISFAPWIKSNILYNVGLKFIQ